MDVGLADLATSGWGSAGGSSPPVADGFGAPTRSSRSPALSFSLRWTQSYKRLGDPGSPVMTHRPVIWCGLCSAGKRSRSELS